MDHQMNIDHFNETKSFKIKINKKKKNNYWT